MASLNGVGTQYRGWRHAPDGTSTATRWFIVIWLPLVPLRRHRVRVLTDFENEPFATPGQALGALGGHFAYFEEVQVLERTPLSWSEIGRTYLDCWVLIPLGIFLPVVLLRVVLDWWREHHGRTSPAVEYTAMALYGLYVIVFLGRAVRRMRGAGRVRQWDGSAAEPARR